MPGMRRREFITLLGGGAAAWPFAARAQQSAPVVGLLVLPDPFMGRLRAFHDGLDQLGFHEGRNVAIELNWDGQYDRFQPARSHTDRRRKAR